MCERSEMKVWLSQVEATTSDSNRTQAAVGRICGNCSTCRRLKMLLDPLAPAGSCQTDVPGNHS